MNARRLAAATASIALLVACGGTLSTGATGGPACDAGTPCGALCCTGTCTSGRCLVVLASGQNEPGDVAVDPGGAYWSAGRALMKVGLDGGTPVMVVPGPDGPGACIALGGGRVVWTNIVNGTGSIQSLVLGGNGPPVSLASGAWYACPAGVAIADAKTVLWVGKRLSSGSVVMKVPLGGGAAVTLATISNVLSQPRTIATDGASAYWTDGGADTVMKVPLAGGSVVTLASKQALPFGIAVGGSNVYWTDDDGGKVMATAKSPASGAQPSTLASGQDRPSCMAVDASHLYWANDGSRTIMRLPLGGGKPVKLVSGQRAKNIVVDQTSVYWADPFAGNVMKLTPK